MSLLARRTLAFALPLVVVGCAHGNRLADFDYRDRTVAVVSDVPRRPEVLSGSYFLGGPTGDPVRDIVRVGARIFREAEAIAVQERLDAASELVDVGEVLEGDALDRTARYLGADAVSEQRDADYLLEIIVVEYGIDAEAWDAAAQFYIEADATLLDEGTGTEIWRAEIEARDPIGPAVFGGPSAVRDIVTAATIADLSVQEIVDMLESLADFSARVITDRLRDDLRDARN
ncbi:MAG: hypothetical protein ABL963_13035 [Longimicrobiales bacterium]